MLNPFTKHPNESGKTWLQHTKFALRVSARLALTTVCFFFHGLFPFLPIPGTYNFECTIEYLENMNKDVS